MEIKRQTKLVVEDRSQVSEVRRMAVAMATAIGFDEASAGQVAIVATELASNLVKHARKGHVLAQVVEHATRPGMDLFGIDKGPGIGNMSKVRG